MYNGNRWEFTPNEWKIIRLIPYATSINDLVKSSGLPPYTVTRILKKFIQNYRVSVSFYWHSRAVGLVPSTIVISSRPAPLKSLPYTVAIRQGYMPKKVYIVTGKPPERYFDEYLSLFSDEPLLTIRGVETTFWNPNSPTNVWSNGVVVPNFSAVYDMFGKTCDYRPGDGTRRVDKLDLIILQHKERYAFTKLSEIARSAQKHEDPEVKRATRQLLSYHFREHVLPLWTGNAVKIFMNLMEVPIRLFILEGKDAPNLARAIVNIPHFFTALIGEKSAVVSAQLPCSYHESVWRIFSDFNVDVTEIVLSSEPTPYVYLDLTRYLLPSGEWMRPEEALVVCERRTR